MRCLFDPVAAAALLNEGEMYDGVLKTDKSRWIDVEILTEDSENGFESITFEFRGKRWSAYADMRYEGVFQLSDTPENKDNNRANYTSRRVREDVMGLSSGTLASLSGNRDYEYLENLQRKFIQFTIGALDSDPGAYKDWHEAWQYFCDTYDLSTLEVT